jgi:hypothetical protein
MNSADKNSAERIKNLREENRILRHQNARLKKILSGIKQAEKDRIEQQKRTCKANGEAKEWLKKRSRELEEEREAIWFD